MLEGTRGTPPIRAVVGQSQSCAVSLVCEVREHRPRVAKDPQVPVRKNGIHEILTAKISDKHAGTSMARTVPNWRSQGNRPWECELDNNMVGGVLPSPHRARCVELVQGTRKS